MRPSVDKKSWIPGILNLPNQRAYAKMPSLVHQMPSLAKCISQMANCWRAIFIVFGKFLECITQIANCWRCSKALFRGGDEKFSFPIAFSFLFDNYYLIMD